MTDQHVYPLGGWWAVKSEGALRPHATARTQFDAICIARQLAYNTRSRVVVRGETGKEEIRHDFSASN